MGVRSDGLVIGARETVWEKNEDPHVRRRHVGHPATSVHCARVLLFD